MSDGLIEDSVDIPLAPLNQTPAKHAGPLGRIQAIKNMAVTHYTPTEGGPLRLKAEPRGAFVSLSTDTRDPKTGASSSVPWANPELFAELSDQPLSICNAVPRVWNGEDASIAYDDKRVVTNKLDESVFHTSDRTIQAPDSRVNSGVTCSAWSEKLSPANSSVALFVGFKAANGTWITPPRVIYDPDAVGDAALIMARVVADDDGEHFWVVYNCLKLGAPKFRVQLFNLRGELEDTDDDLDKIWLSAPGYWDVTKRHGGGLFFAQPLHPAASFADGVKFTAYSQSSGVIGTPVTTNNPDINCRGPLSWASNKLDTKYYLLTVGLSEDPGGKLWGYQLSSVPNPATNEYDYEVGIPGDGFPDSLIGYVKEDTDPMATAPVLTAAYTVLPLTAQTVGPAFDPALRYIQVYSCDFANNVSFLAQNNSVCIVSRAFEHDGEWYAFTYYQSGSGLAISETSIEVEITTGDYMIGARDQPLNVKIGDRTIGSVKTVVTQANAPVIISVPLTAQSIDGAGTPDKVEYFLSSGYSGVPDNVWLLRWTFKNLTAVPVINGGRLRVSGSSIPSANGDWDLLFANATSGAGSHEFITFVGSINGTHVNDGNFTSGGTAEIVSMSTYICPSIDRVYGPSTQSFLNGGSLHATGSDSPGCNGTFTISRALSYDIYPGSSYVKGVRVYTTTQAFSGTSAINCELTPISVNTWEFDTHPFSDVLTDVPHKFEVSGNSFALNATTYSANGNVIQDPVLISNDGEYAITDVISAAILKTDGSEITASIFDAPLPAISIHVPLDVRTYTFKLQSLTLDYTYNGALVFVRNAMNPENNGLYKISFVDVGNGTFIAEPVDGRTLQRSESFLPDGVGITIFFSNNIQPVFQPKWFVTPLFRRDTAHVGRFEDGLAYADWRIEGDQFGPNNFPLHVASVSDVASAIRVILPYRARSFTSGQPLVAPPNQVAEASVTISQSTVGTKQFELKQACGTSSAVLNELFLPGPLTSVFTSSGFREQGINVAPESPFIVSQETISDDVHITPGTKHQIVVTYEVTDENGNRIFCPPSPALDIQLTGTNNCETYGGRLPLPLDSGGVPIVNRHGLTNHRIVGITISRTAYQGDLPTIIHYKITDDLNVNGLAPVSDLNASGFSFPDEFTWYYKDCNPDVSILTSEELYTDKGFLPRFPATASKFSSTWQLRPWIVGYDGSLQFGGEFTEGDAPWFFPGFRYTFGNDKAVSCAPMGSYLIVGCENSIWYIPQPSAFPDASGRNGKLPNPIQLDKIKSGCTGLMLSVDGGVAYSSTVGGIWMITQNFQNVFMSRDIQDQLSNATNSVTAMKIDGNNRMHVATGTAQMFTYDQVVQTWYNWELPTATGRLLALVDGEVAVQDNARLIKYTPSQFIDDIDGDLTPIAWRIKFSDFNFGGVRRFKHCWAFQILGEYLGQHRLFAIVGYPDDNYEPPSLRGPYVPSSSDPYLAEVNPAIEEASTYSLELYVDFEGVENPGQSASIELVAAAVGLESGQAQTNRRLE